MTRAGGLKLTVETVSSPAWPAGNPDRGRRVTAHRPPNDHMSPASERMRMSLHPRRTVAYLAGACAGGFTTAAVVNACRRDVRAVARWLVVALLAGALAVLFEEAAPDET